MKIYKGFTVLEFLIVLAIILILVSIAFGGLVPAREKAVNEKKITELKTIALGIEEFAQACDGYYPEIISPSTPCQVPRAGISLGMFIPDIDQYKFNVQGSEYRYAPLAIDGGDENECVGYHMGVVLSKDTNRTLSSGDADFNSELSMTEQGLTMCGTTEVGFNGTDPTMFDITHY